MQGYYLFHITSVFSGKFPRLHYAKRLLTWIVESEGRSLAIGEQTRSIPGDMKMIKYAVFLLTFWILVAYISRALKNDLDRNDRVFDPSVRNVKTDGLENLFWFVQVRNSL